MLQLSGSLLNRPVLSLQTGAAVAITTTPIINPNNLKIEGFFCIDAFDRKKLLVLLYQDIREVIPQGLVVNDHDVLAEPMELVRLRDTINLHFELLGKHVISSTKDKIGKVTDYAAEVETMYIQKIYVAPTMFKNLTGGNIGIDRSQIIEITDKNIIIQDMSARIPAGARAIA